MLRQLVSMLMLLLLCHFSFLGFLHTPILGCCRCSELAFYFQLCVIVFAAVAAFPVKLCVLLFLILPMLLYFFYCCCGCF